MREGSATDFWVGSNGAEAKRRLDQGFEMVSIITDQNVLAEGMARELSAARGQSAEGGKLGVY